MLAFTIPVAGKLADRYPPYILVSCGLGLLALSFALMAVGATGSSYSILIAWAIIGRIGLGFVLPALSLGAMRGVDIGLIPQGASAINFLRQLGGAIGVSLVGIILEWRLTVYQSGLEASGSGNMTGTIRAFNETFLFVAVVCASAIFAAWRMRAKPLE